MYEEQLNNDASFVTVTKTTSLTFDIRKTYIWQHVLCRPHDVFPETKKKQHNFNIYIDEINNND